MIITTPLGNIGLSIDSKNLKLQMFLDSLKDKIEIYGLDEIINVIDNAKSVKELKDKVSELEDTIVAKENEIEELENPDNFDAPCDSTIKCGIGEINYETPNNILLQELMGNLDEAVQKNTAKKVSEILSSIS